MNVKLLITDCLRFSINMNFFSEDEGLPEELGSVCLKFEYIYEPITIAEIEAIHQRIANSGRKYKNLTVERFICAIKSSAEDIRPAAFKLFEMLSETVKEFTITENYASWNINDLAQILISLPNVITYTLKHCQGNKSSAVLDQRFLNGDFDFLEIVEELEMFCCNEYILNLFSSCTKLKRFAMVHCQQTQDDRLNEFLNRQTQLEHLKIYRHYNPVNLADWLTFSFKLKHLDISNARNDIYAAPLFFEQQNELKSLGIHIWNNISEEDERKRFLNSIASIWRLPKLKNLKITFDYDEEHQIGLPETFFDDLPRNNTIRNVTVYNPIKNSEVLFNSLDALKKIEIGCYNLDLSDWRLDVIAKIAKFDGEHLIYAPEWVSENIVEFEEIFSQLLQRWRSGFKKLNKIYIGHLSWLHYRKEFQLSLEFCKSLMKSAPHLEELKLYNVHPDFAAYLAVNKPNSMYLVELHVTDSSIKKINFV